MFVLRVYNYRGIRVLVHHKQKLTWDVVLAVPAAAVAAVVAGVEHAKRLRDIQRERESARACVCV